MYVGEAVATILMHLRFLLASHTVTATREHGVQLARDPSLRLDYGIGVDWYLVVDQVMQPSLKCSCPKLLSVTANQPCVEVIADERDYSFRQAIGGGMIEQ